MNMFSRHPNEQGITYLEHLVFAIGIAGRLLASVIAFALHAVLPFSPIARRLDLEATAAFLLERNRFIENAGADRWQGEMPTAQEPQSATA